MLDHLSHRAPRTPPQPTPMARHVNCAVLAFGCVFGAALAPAHAQESGVSAPAARHRHDIAPGPLGESLAEFASKAGVTIQIDSAVVEGRRTQGLAGTVTVQEGFARLLSGSGLEATERSRHIYVLRGARAEPTLPTISVNGAAERESAWGPVAGYVARNNASGTKTDSALMETTKSVSVVTRDQMRDQGVQTVEEALRYTAGVDPEGAGYDLRRPWTGVRGFGASYYRDGVKAASGDDNLGYFSWAAEPYGLERVEVLKGPSSILYGRGEPGGIINQVSKMPTEETMREISVSAGSYDRYQTNFDVGGKADANGDLLFRFTGLVRDSRTQTDHSRDDRIYLAPSLTWRPSGATSLTLKAEYLRDRVTPKAFYPANSLIASNPNGAIPISAFIGEPGYDRYDRDQSAVSYVLRHQLNDGWSFNQNAHFGYSKIDYRHAFGIFWSHPSSIFRFAQNNQAQFHTLTVDSNLHGTVRTGAVTHDLLFGADYQRSDLRIGQTQYAAGNINPFDPVYTGSAGFVQNANNVTTDESVQKGLYLQDQVRVGRSILNAGLRHDKSKHATRQPVGSYTLDLDDARTTYNAGAGYMIHDGLMVYANYSTSFNPARGRAFDLTPFRASTGRQLEAGVKYEPVDSNSLFTGSVFDLRKKNVTTADPQHMWESVQLGEVRVRGLELEAKTALSNRLDLLASYTYLDSEILQDSAPVNIGRSTFNAKNSAAIWGHYTFTQPAWQGLSVGAGVRYIGKIRIYDFPQADAIPSRTLVDATLKYQVGKVTYSLNAANLFDKVSNVGAYFNQRRFVNATIHYRW